MCAPGGFATTCSPLNDIPCCALPVLLATSSQRSHILASRPCSKLSQAGLLKRLLSLQGLE